MCRCLRELSVFLFLFFCFFCFRTVVPLSTIVPLPDWKELVLPMECVPTFTSSTFTLNQLPLYLGEEHKKETEASDVQEKRLRCCINMGRKREGKLTPFSCISSSLYASVCPLPQERLPWMGSRSYARVWVCCEVLDSSLNSPSVNCETHCEDLVLKGTSL